jgi:hypothetical protein
MAVSIVVAVILGVYVMVMALTLYICVLADPDKSPMALYFSYTLPEKIMTWISQWLGPTGTQLLEALMDRFLAIIYLTVVMGGFFVLWTHAYPWVEQSTHVPNYHRTLGYMVFVFALYTWRLTMTTRYVLVLYCTVHISGGKTTWKLLVCDFLIPNRVHRIESFPALVLSRKKLLPSLIISRTMTCCTSRVEGTRRGIFLGYHDRNLIAPNINNMWLVSIIIVDG